MSSAEKENVFRTLRDEELFVTFWGCRWGFHKWLKYREPVRTRESLYDVISQSRYCGSCNIVNRKIISRT